jgi:hypothetical protein
MGTRTWRQSSYLCGTDFATNAEYEGFGMLGKNDTRYTRRNHSWHRLKFSPSNTELHSNARVEFENSHKEIDGTRGLSAYNECFLSLHGLSTLATSLT